MKFIDYRNHIAAHAVAPISWLEWKAGRISGRLQVYATRMAARRGDHASVAHSLLAVWAGNQSSKHDALGTYTLQEIRSAIKDGRLRIVVESPTGEKS